jgi:hypothetical protein
MLVECATCHTAFDKKLAEIRKTHNNNFCSRSCAAKLNGKLYPKRSRVCKICGEQAVHVIISRGRYCEEHIPTRCLPDDKITIEEIINKNKQPSNRYGNIRSRAKEKFRHLTACQKCGYDKHIEICHIKPISQFPKDTLVSVINNESNITVLCPNCHWEFDHGLF